jgi:hypothetical protein
MIRNKFHNFLKLQLAGIMRASQELTKWTKECKEYAKNNKSKKSKEKNKEKNADYEVM